MDFKLDDFLKKYDVHPETESFLRSREAEGGKTYIELGPVEARKEEIKCAEVYGGKTEFDGTEKEHVIPSPDNNAGIPVSVYRPTSCDDTTAPSILVYFHGGGNVVGCRKTHETVCKILARESNCIVVNVEYRLAPEHKFPANHNDAVSVIHWVAFHKTPLGGNEESKIGVAGDNAGAKLAATVCHEAHQLIHFAVLAYPCVSYSAMYPSLTEFENGPVLSRPIGLWILSNYLNEESERESPRGSPIHNKAFSYLPPTLIIVAELDPQRDGSYEYYKKLKDAGVDVHVTTIKGVPHGFWHLAAHFKETGQQAHKAATTFIKAQQYEYGEQYRTV